MRNLLTDYETRVLANIARKTGQDSWFCINQNKQDNDRVYDKKNNKSLPLKKGIKQLMEEIDFDIFEALTNVEKWTLTCLLADL